MHAAVCMLRSCWAGCSMHAAAILGRMMRAVCIHSAGATTPAPRLATQVFELAPGAASQRMWQEVALLRDCLHERLVPLYGVAVSVSPSRRQQSF